MEMVIRKPLENANSVEKRRSWYRPLLDSVESAMIFDPSQSVFESHLNESG